MQTRFQGFKKLSTCLLTCRALRKTNKDHLAKIFAADSLTKVISLTRKIAKNEIRKHVVLIKYTFEKKL
jgi:hypothetical protein